MLYYSFQEDLLLVSKLAVFHSVGPCLWILWTPTQTYCVYVGKRRMSGDCSSGCKAGSVLKRCWLSIVDCICQSAAPVSSIFFPEPFGVGRSSVFLAICENTLLDHIPHSLNLMHVPKQGPLSLYGPSTGIKDCPRGMETMVIFIWPLGHCSSSSAKKDIILLVVAIHHYLKHNRLWRPCARHTAPAVLRPLSQASL